MLFNLLLLTPFSSHFIFCESSVISISFFIHTLLHLLVISASPSLSCIQHASPSNCWSSFIDLTSPHFNSHLYHHHSIHAPQILAHLIVCAYTPSSPHIIIGGKIYYIKQEIIVGSFSMGTINLIF